MRTFVLMLVALLPLVSSLVLMPGHSALSASKALRSPAVSMAHHVQKKATKKHQANRPRKTRPSDINRKPVEYPAIPDIPWMSPVGEQKVTIEIEPTDTTKTLSAKLKAAGAVPPAEFMYGGSAVTGTLGENGLDETKTVEASIR